jgi:hypothetical protein
MSTFHRLVASVGRIGLKIIEHVPRTSVLTKVEGAALEGSTKFDKE